MCSISPSLSRSHAPCERGKFASRGFTLVELLAVIAIIAIVTAASIPAISGITASYNLAGSANSLAATINYARQEAVTLNVPVEIRFYQYVISGFPAEPAGGGFHAYQLFEDLPAGPQALNKIQFFPGRIVLSPDPILSPMLQTSGSNVGSTPPTLSTLPSTYTYIYYTFSPNGTTDLPQATNNNDCLTLVDAANAGTGGSPPKNYVTLLIDPISGTTRALRPGS